MTLIALVLPGEGSLTDWWRDTAAPFVGSGRWLLPFVLLLAGWYVEWGPGKESGAPWGRTLLGIAMAYIGLVGLLELTALPSVVRAGESLTGGRIGRFLDDILQPLLTAPGAFVVLTLLLVAGLLIAFDRPLRAMLAPATGLAKAAGSTLSDRTPKDETPAGPAGTPGTPAAVAAGAEAGRRGRAVRVPAGEAPGQVGAFGSDGEMPQPVVGAIAGPMSATFAPARTPGVAGVATPSSNGTVAGAAGATAPGAIDAVNGADAAVIDIAAPVSEATGHPADEPVDASRAAITVGGADFDLPPLDLLDRGDPPAQPADSSVVHERNEAIIKRKLASFGIEAEVIGKNAGPVVTQYVVQPAPHIKLSRIEALADDLAMALAARSIRIEAPIPGKAAVGIEIPNQEFNVVALRRILEEVNLTDPAISRLTFALGRDVAGRAQAVDLAKMPHLLIAGRDRLRQERHGQRADHEPAVQRHPARGPDDPDRPQARGARLVRRGRAAAAPARTRSSPSPTRRRPRSTGPCSRWSAGTRSSRRWPPATSAPTTRAPRSPSAGACRTSSS